MTINAVNRSLSVLPSGDGVRRSRYPGGSGAGADWQLADGHWVPRKFNMVIAHPRPDAETTAYAQCCNAYTGIPWSTRVLIFGGAYPFQFELVSGPSGMTIGEYLVENVDVLEEPDDYGLLEWANPTAGDHTVTVRVYDQDFDRGVDPSAYVEVTFTLTVGTANWVFIDPVSGNNANSGTLASPFLDTTPFITGSDYAGKCVYIRAGTMNLVGMGGGAYAFNGNQPGVFVGYPGETATINFDTGHFQATADDFCLKDLTLRHDSTTYGSSQKMARVGGTDRAIISGCDVTQFKLGSDSAGNASIMFTNYVSGGTNYPCFAYNMMSGTQGAAWVSYDARTAVVHGNVWADCIFSEGDASNLGIANFKDSTLGASVRANQCWDNNGVEPIVTGALWGFKGNNDAARTYGCQYLEFCFNTFYTENDTTRNACIREYNNEAGDYPCDNYHLYRNSIGIRVNAEFSTNEVTNSTREFNVLVTGTFEVVTGITDANNLEAGSELDLATMKLTESARATYLGTHGAEIA